MEKHIGNYIGVVIQNNDPDMRGRIKVFVPHVSTNIYSNWNEDNTNKIFNFVDNEDVLPVIEELKEVLPWAEYAGPIFGGCASGRYNATLKKGTVSDSNAFEDGKPIDGYRALNIYTNELSYPDAFSATGKVGNAMVNPYAYQYIPSNYSNLARGMFSIPNVGSHVWVWYKDGDSNYPIYFATAYGAEDIKRIYTMSQKTGLEGDEATSLHYPATYENIDVGQLNSDAKTFRSQHVINSNKNTVELIDTDGIEKIKLTQYSGSFLEFNNESTIKLSTANDQTMVLGDTYETFWKNKNEFIGGVSDLIIKGDSYEKIGTLNTGSVSRIFDLYKSIHDYKTLFDVQRTASPQSDRAFNKNVTSPFQSQDGEYRLCPVCNGLPYTQRIWRMSPMHFRMCLFIPAPFPGFSGLDIFVPGVSPFMGINGQIGYVHGRFCPLCNRPNNSYIYPRTHRLGYSPSSEDGFWNIEPLKQVGGPLGDLYNTTASEIMDLQSSMGSGGDKINNVARNFVLNVGLVMNDLQSYRVDARGKLKSAGLFVSPENTIVRPEPTPHVEHVDVDALPGGDFIVTAGNKMKFLVGSNGVNIKTFGPIEMYGSITNLTSEQMNILAKHELFIDGGEKLSLRSRHISLNPFEHNPVLVDGGLHVSRNFIVQGGTYLEGEVGVQHITAPEQWYETEDGGCITMLVNTLGPIGGGVEYHIHPLIIQLPDHKHWYKNIPLSLTKCKEETRDIMVQLGINNNTAIPTQPISYPPIGVSGQGAATGNLRSVGVDDSAINGVFGAIGAAIDVGPIENVLASASTQMNMVGSNISNIYSGINATLESNLTEIQNAISNSLLTTI